jgi:23S rRNA pseudouridine2604 synthase
MNRRKKAPKTIHEDGSVSLNKYISASGFCSRREADSYIESGRVTINDEVAITGNRVYENDVVEIDGEPLKKAASTIYIAYNKPKGITATTDPADKTNIIGAIRHPQRIFPVGRLDKDSEGLIFLTNNGDIVNKILRAGNRHEKEYLVSVSPDPTPEFLRKLAAGVRLVPEGKTLPCKVVASGKHSFRITLVQGFNRQIRRMCMALEHKVTGLKRIRVMNVLLGNQPVGNWRYLTPEEVDVLEAAVADSSGAERASRVRAPKAATPKPTTPKTATPKPIKKGADAAAKPAAPEAKVPEKKAPRKSDSFKSFREKGRTK